MTLFLNLKDNELIDAIQMEGASGGGGAVDSVNGKTGTVVLDAEDVGALPSDTTIPTVNNATLTIQKNGTDVQTFTANASSDVTCNITVPTQASDIGAQETLVSGTNIKTINDVSLLGSGNIVISGGGGEGSAVENGPGLFKTTINNTAATTLSANGTMGGNTAACEASFDENNAWKAYANSSSQGWGLHYYRYSDEKSTSTYYTPEAKTLASLSVIYNNTQSPSSYPSSFNATVYASADGTDWDTLGSFSGSKPEVVYTPIVFKPTTFGEYHYFKTEFQVTYQMYDSEGIRINLQFGTPAYAVDVDDNTIKIGSNNKLYAPTVSPEVDLPLYYKSLTVGGMTNYSITSGYLVPTYKSNLSFSYYSGQNYVAVYNSTVSTPSTVAEAFTTTSYIDIPCDVGKLVKDVQAGRRNSVNCVFSSLVGSSGYQSIAWIGGKSDGTTFTPLLFGSVSDMGGGVAFLTGGYTTGGQYENGFTVDSTSTTYGSTDLNGGAGLSITYDGTNWKVLCSGIDPMMMSAMDYHTTSVTSGQVDKLAEINVMRFVNQSGSNTTANNPTVAGFGYNNSSWTPADGAVTTYTLAVKYDDSTIKMNANGELYVDTAALS